MSDAAKKYVNPKSFNSGKRSGLNTPVHPGSTPKSGQADISQILGTSDLGIINDTDDHMMDYA